jgi:hypothetical protein
MRERTTGDLALMHRERWETRVCDNVGRIDRDSIESFFNEEEALNGTASSELDDNCP